MSIIQSWYFDLYLKYDSINFDDTIKNQPQKNTFDIFLGQGGGSEEERERELLRQQREENAKISEQLKKQV